MNQETTPTEGYDLQELNPGGSGPDSEQPKESHWSAFFYVLGSTLGHPAFLFATACFLVLTVNVSLIDRVFDGFMLQLDSCVIDYSR